MYVNVIKNYVEAIIKCRYRLTNKKKTKKRTKLYDKRNEFSHCEHSISCSYIPEAPTYVVCISQFIASIWVHPWFLVRSILLIFLVFCVAVFCFCFVCLRPMSSVPNVVSVSGFSIRFSLMFISGACGSYRDFLGGLLLTRKLLHQGFLVVKLKSSFQRLYGRHHEWPG